MGQMSFSANLFISPNCFESKTENVMEEVEVDEEG